MTYIRNSLKIFLNLFIAGCICFTSISANAVSIPPIIRDTEIENTLREWMLPVFQAAGMGPGSVNLILVQSGEINAFVAGGANIFVYTGLIERTDNPGELIGVMAHELGHIAGGHLIGTRMAYEQASYESILGMILGAGAALAGSPQAANALIHGSGSVAQGRFMANSRVYESSADQAALRYFESAGLNPKGLETFLIKLESEDLLPASQQSAYMRTHPITRERTEAARAGIEKSSYLNAPLPAEWYDQHARMKAKLTGFINPGRVAWNYDDTNHSIPALYARTIASYRQKDIAKALKGMDELLDREPQNPYFHELKGQILRDFGRVDEALPSYQKAVTILPGAGLIRIDYGHALLETAQNADEIQDAVDQLERALRDEPRSSRTHRLLATAYGRLGEENLARLHLAEEAVLQRKFPYAISQAQGVLKNAPAGSREAVQARDIINQAENLAKMKEE